MIHADFAPRGNWRDHAGERALRRWQAAQDAAGLWGFLAGAGLVLVVALVLA